VIDSVGRCHENYTDAASLIHVDDKVKTKSIVAVILLIWIISILIAINVQHEMGEWLNSYNSLMGNFIPIYQYASLSSFPKIAVAYHSIIWWTCPFFFIGSYRYLVGLKGILSKPKKEITISNYFFMTFYGLFFLVIAYATFAFNRGQDARLIKFGTSIEQFLLFGLVFPGLVGFSLAYAFCSFKKIIFGKL